MPEGAIKVELSHWNVEHEWNYFSFKRIGLAAESHSLHKLSSDFFYVWRYSKYFIFNSKIVQININK